MNKETLLPIVRYLYEGGAAYRFDNLAPDTTYRDPLVVVHGLKPVEAMFQRLNRLLPASKVVQFEPIVGQGHDCAWNLVVEYKRTDDAKPFVMRSVLEVDAVQGVILRLTEHWKSPLTIKGNSQSALAMTLRRTLGRLTSR